MGTELLVSLAEKHISDHLVDPVVNNGKGGGHREEAVLALSRDPLSCPRTMQRIG
jgi:hypothetical protein